MLGTQPISEQCDVTGRPVIAVILKTDAEIAFEEHHHAVGRVVGVDIRNLIIRPAGIAVGDRVIVIDDAAHLAFQNHGVPETLEDVVLDQSSGSAGAVAAPSKNSQDAVAVGCGKGIMYVRIADFIP